MAYRVQDPDVESNIIPGKPPSIRQGPVTTGRGYKPFKGKPGYKPFAGKPGYKRRRR